MTDATARTPGSNMGGLSVGTCRVFQGLKVTGTASKSGGTTTLTNTDVTITLDTKTTAGAFISEGLTPLVIGFYVVDTSAAAQVAINVNTNIQGDNDSQDAIGYGPANGQFYELECHRLWATAVAGGTAEIYLRTAAATGGDGVLYYYVICAKAS